MCVCPYVCVCVCVGVGVCVCLCCCGVFFLGGGGFLSLIVECEGFICRNSDLNVIGGQCLLPSLCQAAGHILISGILLKGALPASGSWHGRVID